METTLQVEGRRSRDSSLQKAAVGATGQMGWWLPDDGATGRLSRETGGLLDPAEHTVGAGSHGDGSTCSFV